MSAVSHLVTISLKARPASVHANALKAAVTSAHVSGAISPSSVNHLSDAALRAAVVRNAMMLDDDGPMRVTGNMQNNRVFPPVEEFTLTPPNPTQGLSKTILSVRFPEAQAAKLASSIPMTLAQQNVVLQRSSDDPSTFSAVLDFNWRRFAEEQAQRKIAASQGRTVSIFDGRRFVRTEKMQFVEPAQIQQALQSHQPIQFTGNVLTGSSDVSVYPDHELMMTNLAIVIDNPTNGLPQRTYDQCLAEDPGNPQGAWTFGTLMMAIAGLSPTDNPLPAEQMLLEMLDSFNHQQTINSFAVLPRDVVGSGQENMGTLVNLNGSGGQGLLSFWSIDETQDTRCTLNGVANTCPNIFQAPMMLEAIVNRIDIGANGAPFTPAGELRFVFTTTAELPSDVPPGGITGPCSNQNGINEVFNMILEFHVPSTISADVGNRLDRTSGPI